MYQLVLNGLELLGYVVVVNGTLAVIATTVMSLFSLDNLEKLDRWWVVLHTLWLTAA